MPRILDWGVHDPDEVDGFAIDWTDRLDTSETISSSSWSYTTYGGGADTTVLTLSGGAINNTLFRTTITVDNGTSGTTYIVTNEIVTSASRTLDQSVYLHVRSR